MNTKNVLVVLTALLGALICAQGRTQAIFSEDFTGGSTTNNWYFFNGACLTGGSSTSTTSPGNIPGCKTVWSNYYSSRQDSDPYLVGGYNGYLGSTTAPGSGATQTPDPTVNGVGTGALRFTNGYPYGHQERGAILSSSTFATGAGIQVTFKTITYRGDGGGTGKDGADGISFFLMDGSFTPTAIGATGGSLGYSCTNESGNVPYDGLTGAYIGLGIDEFGNFLNGTNLVAGYSGNTATGDNSAYGYGFKPNRIGMRGAGSISWTALTAAYGTYQGSGLPYYPASLATTYGSSGYSCGTGTNNNNEFCWSCPTAYTAYSGAPSTPAGAVTGTATSCAYTLYGSTSACPTSYTAYSGAPSSPTGAVSLTGGKCIDTFYASTATCPTTLASYSGATSIGTISYSTTAGKCIDTVNPGNHKYNGPSPTVYNGPATAAYTAVPTTTAVTVTGGSGTTLAQAAVQQACSTGNLYNYYDPAAPVSITTATLTTSTGATNSANPAGILDYAPIPGAYQELSGFTIANESATTRAQGTPIFYNLKITIDGKLSLSYSTNGGAYTSVISNQLITTANGPLPSVFRFGFAGSTGGDTNVHEIMCFKAASANTSGSSATVNEKQAAKVQAGTQAYFAFYNPNDWTGALTANTLQDNGQGVVSVLTPALWDASCVLSGTATGNPTAGTGGCATTGASGPTSPLPGWASRVMLTWDTKNSVGIPFEWNNLNTDQQGVLDNEGTQPADTGAAAPYRLNYLRGDTSNELTSTGSGVYRPRDGILADIVDSSPSWVGPPSSPYTITWQDRLQPAVAMVENITTNQSYLQYVTADQGRLNVVYAGANDGFLHGFRAGSFDSNGVFCGATGSLITCASTPNDGQEVLAYMPGSTLISSALSTTTGGCTSLVSTGTMVQNIHGWTPTVGGTSQCETPQLDYSSTQYGHNFFVDATPGTGDLFYGGKWHTWLAGGLGAGGAAIYALDVSDPSTFAEGAAGTLVIGEWNPSTITCAITTTANASNCGQNLGNTYGAPQIRRLHNGDWGVIFGNGFGSQSGDAGIYVMTIDSGSGAKAFYYLSTNAAGGSRTVFSGTGYQGTLTGTPAATNVVTITAVTSGFVAVGDVLSGTGIVAGSIVTSFGSGTGGTGTYNVSTSGMVASGTVTAGTGIAYTTPADLDGDHITDYVYAGDLNGNVWRFDLTSSFPGNWGVTDAAGVSVNAPTSTPTGSGYGADASGGGGGAPTPLFTTQSGQPITTQLLAISSTVSGAPRMLIEFGTGQRTQITNVNAATYVNGSQSLYAFWDWNLSAWNNAAPGTQYASLVPTATATGLTSPFTVTTANLQGQTLQITSGTLGTANEVVDETTTNVVCWQGTTTACANSGGSDNEFGWYVNLPSTQEQVIFNPVFFQGSLLVNTTVPANNVATSCSVVQDTGFTYALNIASGGNFASAFPTFTDPKTGALLSGSTTAGVETNATGSVYVVQTVEGKANIVYQTVSGTPGAQQINIPSNTKAKRLTWVELR